MGRDYIRKHDAEDIRKNAAYFRAEGYVSMDRPEICEVARRAIDNVLGGENSVMNTF